MTAKELQFLIQKNFKKIWRCADSNEWGILYNSNLLSINYLESKIDYSKVDINKLDGKRSINAWVNNLKVGDLIFIMGKNYFNGVAIAKSKYDLNGPKITFSNGGIKPCIEIEYIFKQLHPSSHDLETHNNPTTFADIDQYSFGLHNTLVTLQQKIPDAFKALSEYITNKELQAKLLPLMKLLNYKKQIILQGPPGTGKTREAKLIAKEILGLNDVGDLKDIEQFKLVQFHPSYTYEDFVRGIVARPNPEGAGMLYIAENKVLGDFADKALKNFLDAQKAPEVVSKESWIREKYQIFKDKVETDLENQEVLIKEGNTPKIIAIEIDAIRVNRYSDENDSVLIKDSDIINGYIGLHFSNPAVKIKENTILSKSARSGMYYLYQNLIEKFDSFLKVNNFSFDENSNMIRISEKPYVIIVDEINRANLSSVLGELIYALEYRGEAVESMYAIENESKNKLILPPNLYIIGTMNTADRSVGHIDYAIRRRFAFVDVLPQDLTNDSTIKFDGDLFHAVKDLFTTDDYKTHSNNLSREFEPKDVALGHSYFIQHYEKDANGNEDKTKPIDFKFRLEYEIKPILLEYVKDGVLVGENIKQTIEELNSSI
ncbi:AAA family ATPase [Flavobacterium rhizosphaerae]|uniref:AAA family ATPase n=1 Tax=Flavobacterium rhizosphaerae TaxID=3163298 RepID=A0ABW8Z097_9FLAO